MTTTELKHFPLIIGGEKVDTEAALEIVDPSTGEVVATAACGTAEHIDRAVEAAQQAFEGGDWSRATPAHRAEVLRRMSTILGERLDEIVELELMGNGATVRQATGFHVGYCTPHLEYLADLAARYEFERPGPRTAFPTLGQSSVRREPSGVVGAIAPWNFPLLLSLWKWAPALAVGNSVVLKPDEKTPLSALALAEIGLEAGLPPGVFNVVPGIGADAGSRLASHPGVGKIGFTGSTAIGREVMRLASGTVKAVTLELGGKSPAVVLDDADLETTVDGVLYGCMLRPGLRVDDPPAGPAGAGAGVRRPAGGARLDHPARRHPRLGDRHGSPGQREAAAARPRLHRERPLRGGHRGPRRRGPGGRALHARLLGRADHLHRRPQRHADRPGGDLRPRPVGHRLRRRGGGRTSGADPVRTAVAATRSITSSRSARRREPTRSSSATTPCMARPVVVVTAIRASSLSAGITSVTPNTP